MAKAEVAEVNQQKCKPAGRGIRWRPVIESGIRTNMPCTTASVQSSQSPSSDFSTPEAHAPNPSSSESLAARLNDVLDSTARTGHDIMILGEWLAEITPRIGYSIALDAAIEALLLSHKALIDRESRDDVAMTKVYGQALQALTTAIGCEKEEISTETICAALALCDVEVCFRLV